MIIGRLYVYLGDDAFFGAQPTRAGDYRIVLGETIDRERRWPEKMPEHFTARVDRRALEQLHRCLGEFLELE